MLSSVTAPCFPYDFGAHNRLGIHWHHQCLSVFIQDNYFILATWCVTSRRYWITCVGRKLSGYKRAHNKWRPILVRQ